MPFSESMVRVGIDLVRIRDVKNAMDRFGERYLSRVFTPNELRDCGPERATRVSHLAARFAAKEAVVKALSAGHLSVNPRDIEVRRGSTGACALSLKGPALRRARKLGVGSWALSLTHEGAYAAAVVVAKTVPIHLKKGKESRRSSK